MKALWGPLGLTRIRNKTTIDAWARRLASDKYAADLLEAVGCNPLRQAFFDEVRAKGVFPMLCCRPATNVFSTLHGGALMSLVDVVANLHATASLSGADGTVPRLATVQLTTQFIQAVPQGTEFAAVSTTSMTNDLVFSRVDFVRLDQGCLASPASSSPFASGSTVQRLLK
jgi:acyl-coenzyme A thioesterase PaaI-like protein